MTNRKIWFLKVVQTSLFFILLLACTKKNVVNYVRPGQDLKDSLIHQLNAWAELSPDSSLSGAFRLLQVDSISKDSVFYYTVEQNIGHSYFYLGKYDSSLFHLRRSLNYWKIDNSNEGPANYARTLCNIAYITGFIGQNENAKNYFDSLLLFTETHGLNEIFVTSALNQIKLLMDCDEYGRAIELVEKSIAKCKDMKDSSLMLSTLQSYADLYTNCSFFDEAEKIFQEVLNYDKFFTPYSRQVHHNNKGRMYYLSDDLRKARKEFLLADSIALTISPYHTLITGMNLAEIYLYQNLPDSAQYYFDRLDQYTHLMSDFPIFRFNYASLKGDYLSQLQNYKQAGIFFARADSIAEQNSIDNVVKKLHVKREAAFYRKTGDFAKASDALLRYNVLNQKVLEENNRRQVAALKFRYERDATVLEQKNALIEKEIQIKNLNYRLLFFSGLVFSLLLVLLFVFMINKKRKQLEHEKNIRKVAALKMESIRGRLSPHFLFNVLNNIWSSIDDRESARNQFDNLTRLIRQSLINTEELAIPLRDEIEFVKSFIELQAVRLNNDLTVEWQISDTINLDQPVPGMILQIPVENAIKHGLEPKKNNRLLRIEVQKDFDCLLILVKDNGVGMQTPSSLTRGTGTGLKVLTNTIYILNRMNDNKMTYDILNGKEDDEIKTIVKIRIPLVYCFDLK